MQKSSCRALIALVILGACFAPPRLHAGETYYILLFGAQREPPRARYAHTWATYVRAVGDGDDRSNYKLEARTNSWLPADLDVRPWKPCPQQGVNLDLEASLRFAIAERANIAEWGPHEILPEIYERGISEIQRLDEGSIQYRAVDGFSRRSNIKNCFHSISDILDRRDSRFYYPLRQNGFPVTYDIVKSLRERGKIVNPGQDNTWIDRRLGLDAYPIIHHPYDPASPGVRPRGNYLRG